MKKRHYLKLILIISISLTFCLIGCNTNKDKEAVLSSNVLEDLNNDKLDIMDLLQRGDDCVTSEDYVSAKSFYEKAVMKDKMNIDTYLNIKDQYLEVNRLDDAYYFVNLAIDNNVDTENMKLILDEIKSKFEAITLSNTIVRFSTFSLPTTVDISVNNTDTETTDVTWETTPSTNELGTFTYNGYCNKYHRTITYNLTIKKPDYSTYSGLWVSENNLKIDYYYGITINMAIDGEGNIDGLITNSTNNVTHISMVGIKCKIQDNKFTCKFDNDNWEHSGNIDVHFKDNKVTLTINYTNTNAKTESYGSIWGIGKGTFTLVKDGAEVSRTLNDLEKGGFNIIKDQCFSVNFGDYHNAKFIIGSQGTAAFSFLKCYLIDNENNVLYKFSDFNSQDAVHFTDIKAVSFTDVNNDGLKDVIIIAGFANDTICNLYLQNGKQFICNDTYDNILNSSISNKDIESVLAYTTQNPPK